MTNISKFSDHVRVVEENEFGDLISRPLTVEEADIVEAEFTSRVDYFLTFGCEKPILPGQK